MQLELNTEEGRLMQDVLTSYLSDLSYEVRNTDSQAYRNGLKEKANTLRKILEDLESQTHTQSQG